ncbi:MAG: hypothetical protein ABIA04_11805 [Pseudomonadota bacterium]
MKRNILKLSILTGLVFIFTVPMIYSNNTSQLTELAQKIESSSGFERLEYIIRLDQLIYPLDESVPSFENQEIRRMLRADQVLRKSILSSLEIGAKDSNLQVSTICISLHDDILIDKMIGLDRADVRRFTFILIKMSRQKTSNLGRYSKYFPETMKRETEDINFDELSKRASIEERAFWAEEIYKIIQDAKAQGIILSDDRLSEAIKVFEDCFDEYLLKLKAQPGGELRTGELIVLLFELLAHGKLEYDIIDHIRWNKLHEVIAYRQIVYAYLGSINLIERREAVRFCVDITEMDNLQPMVDEMVFLSDRFPLAALGINEYLEWLDSELSELEFEGLLSDELLRFKKGKFKELRQRFQQRVQILDVSRARHATLLASSEIPISTQEMPPLFETLNLTPKVLQVDKSTSPGKIDYIERSRQILSILNEYGLGAQHWEYIKTEEGRLISDPAILRDRLAQLERARTKIDGREVRKIK